MCCSSGSGSGNGSGYGGMMGGGGCCRPGPSSPTNLTWSVTVAGVTKSTNGTTISFTEPNGSWAYTVTPPNGYEVTSSVPGSPVTIDGAGVTVNVTFAPSAVPVSLTITFEESGLPNDTSWCVSVGVSECSAGQEIVFTNLSAGSYSFSVAPVSGFTARPSSGTIRLVDQDAIVQIKFTATTHICHM